MNVTCENNSRITENLTKDNCTWSEDRRQKNSKKKKKKAVDDNSQPQSNFFLINKLNSPNLSRINSWTVKLEFLIELIITSPWIGMQFWKFVALRVKLAKQHSLVIYNCFFRRRVLIKRILCSSQLLSQNTEAKKKIE